MFVLSRSMSPNLSNRSSPLTFNVVNHTSSTECPDPFANGADIQISNIDYRLSRKELQQTLQETFSRHGKVKGKIPSLNLFLNTSCLCLHGCVCGLASSRNRKLSKCDSYIILPCSKVFPWGKKTQKVTCTSFVTCLWSL